MSKEKTKEFKWTGWKNPVAHRESEVGHVVIIVSMNKITTMENLEKRIAKVKKECGATPNYIIVETKTAFSQYHFLLSGKPMGKGSYYNFSFQGIPLLLTWQIRI